MEIEVKIGSEEDGGVKICIDGDFVQVSAMGTGWLTSEEAQMAAEMLVVLARYTENKYGH